MSGCSVKKEVTGVPQCSDTPVVFYKAWSEDVLWVISASVTW